jgi:hypothetical protein
MVIDSGGNPRLLPTIAYGREPRIVLVTPEAARQLAGEPIELVAGPDLKVEGMKGAKSKLLPPSEHNIGWALPTLQMEVKGSYPDKGGPSYPSNDDEPSRSSESAPAQPSSSPFLLVLVVLLCVALSGFFVWKQLFQPSQTATAPALADTKTHTSSVGLLTPLPYFITPTPAPIGFGSILIRSEPTDARIYVNDVLVGKKSPVKLEHQSNQEGYKLIVVRKNYKPYAMLFNVEPGHQVVMDVKLQKEDPDTRKEPIR